MAQTCAWFSGWETGAALTGNMRENSDTGGGTAWTVQSSVKLTGGFSAKRAAGDNNRLLFVVGLNATQVTSAVRYQFSANQTSTAVRHICFSTTSNNVQVVNISHSTSQTMDLAANATTGNSGVSGSIVMAANTPYMIELTFDAAAGGIIQTRINGVLDINTTHTSDVTGTPIDRVGLAMNNAGATNTGDWYVDDCRVDIGGVTPIGVGRVLCRQGTTGTPTYDTWTKNGGATSAADAWSEAPMSATKNCSSSTSGAVQTMPIEKFSVVSTGHGTEVINSVDTVSAFQIGIVGLGASNTAPLTRRRIGSTDVDNGVLVTLFTADTYTRGPVKQDAALTPANMDLLEAGVVKAASAILTTIEDVYVMVWVSKGGYSLTATKGTFSFTGQSILKKISMAAAKGVYTFTGVAASLPLSWRLIAGTGTYALTGVSATLSFVAAALADSAGILWRRRRKRR